MLTAAIASLGIESMESWNFTLAVFGILGIGIANVVGAFTCSMLVALRAREVKAVQRQKIYRAFLHRIFKRSVR
jgi:site-specific recombinase